MYNNTIYVHKLQQYLNAPTFGKELKENPKGGKGALSRYRN